MRQNSSILQYGVRACIILSFKFWFLVVHSVCHLDFGGGNLHVKYLCAVANFYDEYYLVIEPFCLVNLSIRRVTPPTRVFKGGFLFSAKCRAIDF